jgi:hypothetical protein
MPDRDSDPRPPSSEPEAAVSPKVSKHATSPHVSGGHSLAAHATLLARIAELETENMTLRNALEADAAILELRAQLRRLEIENRELQTRTEEAEAMSVDYGERFADFEREFSNLANLYVASSQLHSTMSPRAVTRRIKDILAQLVGAESYGVYLANAERTELVPIASEGIPADGLRPLSSKDGVVGRAFHVGEVHVCEGDPSRGTLDDPAAVVPLSVDEGVVGLVVVIATLEQKTCFELIDHELFKLLARHAAAALVGASLFVASGKRIPGLEAFIDLSV